MFYSIECRFRIIKNNRSITYDKQQRINLFYNPRYIYKTLVLESTSFEFVLLMQRISF